MKAVVIRGTNEVGVDTVDDARVEAPTDVLLRVTSAAVCGTDLHIYEGRMGDVRGMIIGHEPLGVVEEVGSAVVSIEKGDRVTVTTHINCGFCVNCVRGYTDVRGEPLLNADGHSPRFLACFRRKPDGSEWHRTITNPAAKNS
jgi:glutathione-independent formaldehyde dehydrogenase